MCQIKAARHLNKQSIEWKCLCKFLAKQYFETVYILAKHTNAQPEKQAAFSPLHTTHTQEKSKGLCYVAA